MIAYEIDGEKYQCEKKDLIFIIDGLIVDKANLTAGKFPQKFGLDKYEHLSKKELKSRINYLSRKIGRLWKIYES